MPRKEPRPFGLDHDYSAIGTFDVEPQLQKGLELKTKLQGVIEDISTGDLAKADVKVEIRISDNLRLIVIPRFPVDIIRSTETGETSEPFIVRDVTGEVEYEEEDLPVIVLTGRSDLPSDKPDTSYRFDPLAGHEIIVRTENGNYHETNVRVISGEGEPALRLEVY